MASREKSAATTKRTAEAAATPTGDTVGFGVLVAAVFAAGVASLVYEVVWVRQLGLSLGSTAVAFSVMLSAFLGGLALGGWWMGKRADTDAAPALTLAKVELGAALLGVLAIPALGAAGHAYVSIASGTSGGTLVSLGLRSAVAIVVMLAPATLFGMTFPLATVSGGRLVGGQTAAGYVSAASSFGSAMGALLCGLWFEPAFGLFASACIGAALNLVAAGCAYAVHRRG